MQLPSPVTYQKSVPVSMKEEILSERQKMLLLNPLEAYPLQSYKFLGTLSMRDHVWAYVQAPDNNVYRLKEEDTLSDQSVRVIHIEPGQMQVLVQTSHQGKQIKQIITMKLED